MKKLFFFLVFTAFIYAAFGETSESFTYQGIVRDKNGVPIPNTTVKFKFNIAKSSPQGVVVYSEEHTTTTNNFGLVNLKIGEGSNPLGSIGNIDWGSDKYFLQVFVDLGNGYEELGSQQILSVPIALYAKKAGSGLTEYVAGPGIKIENNVIENTAPDQVVRISGEGATKVFGAYPNYVISSTDNVDDADADSTNEIQQLVLNGNTLQITKGNSVDLSRISGNGWGLLGNSGTVSGFHFIGTTDTQALDIRTNNVLMTRITTKGQIEIHNTGYSIFIGEGAGNSDDLSDNRNVFIGHQSGYTNSAGSFNTSIGFRSFYSNSSGSNNVAIGAEALYSNDVGGNNVAVGISSLYSNISGVYNTALGYHTLFSNRIGSYNTALGSVSLYSNTDGYYNTAIGYEALFTNTTGDNNTAVGTESLFSNLAGNHNTGLGYRSLYSNVNGEGNTALGTKTLYSNTSGKENTACGYNSLQANTTGDDNVALGFRALYTNSTGSYNTATGADANYSNTGGTYNTSTGYRAMYNTTTGSSNSAFGSFALHYNLVGSENVAVGRYAGYGNYNVNFNQCTFVGANSYPTVSRTNVTMLGYGITNNECTGDNQVLLGNTSVTQIRAAVGSITTYSDGRFKTDIRDDVHGLDFILKLKPVSFRKEPLLLHKIWGTPDSLVQKLDFTDMRNRRWIGLIAQDVEKAMLDCGFDFPGLHKPQNEKDVYTIDYVDLIMPIIKSIQELQSQIDSLKMEIEVLKQKNTQLLESNINYESEIKALQQEISEIKKTIGEYISNKH